MNCRRCPLAVHMSCFLIDVSREVGGALWIGLWQLFSVPEIRDSKVCNGPSLWHKSHGIEQLSITSLHFRCCLPLARYGWRWVHICDWLSSHSQYPLQALPRSRSSRLEVRAQRRTVSTVRQFVFWLVARPRGRLRQTPSTSRNLVALQFDCACTSTATARN